MTVGFRSLEVFELLIRDCPILNFLGVRFNCYFPFLSINLINHTTDVYITAATATITIEAICGNPITEKRHYSIVRTHILISIWQYFYENRGRKTITLKINSRKKQTTVYKKLNRKQKIEQEESN